MKTLQIGNARFTVVMCGTLQVGTICSGDIVHFCDWAEVTKDDDVEIHPITPIAELCALVGDFDEDDESGVVDVVALHKALGDAGLKQCHQIAYDAGLVMG